MTERIRATLSHIGLVLFVAVGTTLLSPSAQVFAQAVPDPTLLPVATTQAEDSASYNAPAYNALNVPGKIAGSSYLDPRTSVKIYKLTSATFPTSTSACWPPSELRIPNWGHDYSEGGDEVSLPYNGNTRAILVRQHGDQLGVCGGPWWLFDFTPGVGVSNPRQLTGISSPSHDLTFAFSNNPATPWYAYVAGSDGVVRRIDIRGTGPGTPPIEVPGDGWPVSDGRAMWLHQSENDQFFVWMRCFSSSDCSGGNTVVGYEPSTSTLKTRIDLDLNEPRIDRAGRYVGLVVCPSNPCGISVWDWQTDSILWEQRLGYDPNDPNVIPFGHNSSLRRRWVYVDSSLAFPQEFTRFIPDVPNSQAHLGGPTPSGLIHGNGNWIQHPADLDDQWSLFLHYGCLEPNGCIQPSASWLAPGGMVFTTVRPNGQRRLLGHPYNTTEEYSYFSFAKLSSDGKYVLFTSDMNGSGRHDVFLAEVPTTGGGGSSAQNVVWTNLVNVTETGNSIQKTSGCEGCDAGATSQQQILSGDGYGEFTVGETNTHRYAGLGYGNTNANYADIDFGFRITETAGYADVVENGVQQPGSNFTYASGDVLRVAVEAGVVKYYQNGQLRWTSTATPTYPLLFDTALASLNATINNAVISGNLSP